MKARAALTDGRGKLAIDDIEVSEDLETNEVLVAIKACGVCHSDHDALNWGPSILGHEGAGEVLAVGPLVKSVKPGDRVVANWAVPCGECFHCTRGEHICCEGDDRGVSAKKSLLRGQPLGRCFNIGVLSSHTIVREQAVTRIDVEIPYASACLIGCGVMTGYGAVVNVARMTPGESCTVIGVGGVGLNAIQGARIANAGMIIAVDANQKKLELARTFGATHTILADREDRELAKATEEVKALTEGRGTDYTFEASGVPHLSMVPPLKMVRPRGQAYLLSNIEHSLEDFSLLPFTKDRSFMRPTYGWCHPQIDFPRILDFYSKGRMLLDEMVTKTYPLEDLSVAFDDMFAGKNARGVVTFD